MINTVEKWLDGDKLGIDVWNNKYRFNGESLGQWLGRLSDGSLEVRKLLEDKKFMFGGRILANLNTGTRQGISNCTTLSYVEDTLDDIMDTAKNLALSFKFEAGVGIALSKIRPKGAKIGEKGTADGVLGFLKIFNAITENISRGNQRRGAMFCGLHVDHPDVIDFINIKKKNTGSTGLITSANLSVLMTDEFMEHYKKKESYRKDFIVEDTGEVIEHIVDTVKIMDTIIDTPKTAFEPGILFVDRFKEQHLFGQVYGDKELMVNACTEFIGSKGTICLLGSVNLSNYVVGRAFDFEQLRKDIPVIIRAMDKAHDYGIGRNGLDIQNERAEDYRGLGLGITGLADMFMKLGIVYGSNESVKISQEIASIMSSVAIRTSIELGKELGQPKGILEDEVKLEAMGVPYIKGLRNNSLLSIAPAGSLSLITQSSSGIEPVFRTSYRRKTESLNDTDTYYDVFHKPVQNIIDELGYKPDYCIDSRDVSARDKIDVISAWQKFVDLSISNTTNFPADTKVEEIKDAYSYAWEKGLKGLTVYVDGSIEGVLNDIKEEVKEPIEEPRGIMSKVPEDTFYIPKTLINGCGQAKVMIGFSPSQDKVTDVYYIAKGLGGCSKNIQGEAILISQVLRLGGRLEDVQKSFNGIDACSSCTFARTKGVKVGGKNCPNILLKLVIDLQNEMQKNKNIKPRFNIEPEYIEIKAGHKEIKIDSKYICPVCGEILVPEGGCYTCQNCGHSHCGA